MSRLAVACLLALAACDSVFGVDKVSSLEDAPPPDAFDPGNWQSLAAGESHLCGLRLDHTLWCWGANDHGQLDLDASITSVSAPQQIGTATWTSIRTRSNTTCGIQTDASLWCWGADTSGQVGDSGIADRFSAYQVPGSWREVAPGGYHTCAIDATGMTWCWGDNSVGELGIGDVVPHVGLVAVTGNLALSSIVAGSQHTCGLAADRTAWCWGNDYSGQVGNGMQTPVPQPSQVSVQPWTQITSGLDHVCALRPDNHLRCWGQNYAGQLGTAMPSGSSQVPIKVGDDDVWTSVAAGGRHTCATREDGSLACWGVNDAGQLGSAPSSSDPVPTIVTGGPRRWTTIAAGTYDTCGISDDSHLWCMGRGASSQAVVRAPAQVAGSWLSVEAGAEVTCAIDQAGALYCWGGNAEGQVGDESYVNRAAPVRIAEPSWSRVSIGQSHACAIRDDGTLSCWGFDYYGLGDGSTYRATPTIVAPGQRFDRVACGSGWTCAVEQGTHALYCWGNNYNYQFGTGDTTSYPMPTMVTSQTWSEITAGSTHMCGIGTGGGQCWGSAYYGAIGNGTTMATTPAPVLASPLQLVTRNAHTCAIDADRSAKCWGINYSGELGNGATSTAGELSPVLVSSGAMWSELATGSAHTCGITTTGALWCWGDNSYGALGADVVLGSSVPVQVGTDLGWSHVSAGSTHTCAIRMDGSLWCWGTNYYGEIGLGVETQYGPVIVP